jgi:hypothetical protein
VSNILLLLILLSINPITLSTIAGFIDSFIVTTAIGVEHLAMAARNRSRLVHIALLAHGSDEGDFHNVWNRLYSFWPFVAWHSSYWPIKPLSAPSPTGTVILNGGAPVGSNSEGKYGAQTGDTK